MAALLAYREAMKNNLRGVEEVDSQLMLFKMNDEARTMLQRMGRKMAELSERFYPDNRIISLWHRDIKEELTPGSFPVAQGLAFAAEGLSEEELFASHQYGVINMVLGAALRCVRVSHFDTQEILFRLSEDVPRLYEKARLMRVDDMNSFVPEADIFASLHEKGNMRMFMS